MMKHMLQRLFAEIMVQIPAHKLIVEYPEMMYSLLQTSVTLILQFFLALGMWAWHHFPQLSESRWSWSKETSRTVAPWGEDPFHLPQEMWVVCVAEPDAGEFKGLDLQAPSLVPRLIPLTVCSMPTQRGEAWEIWSCAVTSDWQRVVTGPMVPDCNNCMSIRPWALWTTNRIDAALLTLWPPALRWILRLVKNWV